MISILLVRDFNRKNRIAIIVKITTQFSDNCSNCNDIIREKSIAYRGEHGDLFCINCNDNGITRKKVIQKRL